MSDFVADTHAVIWLCFKELLQEHEAEVRRAERAKPGWAEICFFRALQRPLPSQPDASASGYRWRYVISLKSIMNLYLPSQ